MIFRAFLTAIVLTSIALADQFPSVKNLERFEGKIITNIEIVRKNVFENGEKDQPFYFRWANKLHIKTRNSVIEGELLFKVGEPLDIEKVVESARNIRLRKFIGEVMITASPDGEDGVRLTVTTYDNWTTKIAIYLESGGGSYLYGTALAEDNLLGYGRAVEASYSSSEDNEGYSLYFNEDRLGRTRWSGSFLFSDYTLNNTINVQVNRPQYSLEVPYGISIIYNRSDGTTRLFSGGAEFFRYNRLFNSFALHSNYSIGKEKRLNLYASYNFDDQDYSEYYAGTALNDLFIPEDERYSYPSIGIGGSIIKYDFERYLDEAGTPEDLARGVSGHVTIGRSIPEFGADFIGTRNVMSAEFLARPLKPVFINGMDQIQWWHSGGRSENIRHVSEFKIYFKTFSTSVLAMRALANFAWREEPGYQVVLGGANGLRGYSSHELEGNRLALGNMEYRFYAPITILTVRLGGAAFFDIGDVWREGERVRFGDLKSDVGVGIRLGLTKSSTSRVLRLDISKALTENIYYVSFGTGMIFSLRSVF